MDFRPITTVVMHTQSRSRLATLRYLSTPTLRLLKIFPSAMGAYNGLSQGHRNSVSVSCRFPLACEHREGWHQACTTLQSLSSRLGRYVCGHVRTALSGQSVLMDHNSGPSQNTLQAFSAKPLLPLSAKCPPLWARTVCSVFGKLVSGQNE